jgi:hypothetical protein
MKAVVLLALLLLATWGLSSLGNLFNETSTTPIYRYEYNINGDYSVGSRFTVTSIDTIPPTDESGGIIEVTLSVNN